MFVGRCRHWDSTEPSIQPDATKVFKELIALHDDSLGKSECSFEVLVLPEENDVYDEQRNDGKPERCVQSPCTESTTHTNLPRRQKIALDFETEIKIFKVF